MIRDARVCGVAGTVVYCMSVMVTIVAVGGAVVVAIAVGSGSVVACVATVSSKLQYRCGRLGGHGYFPQGSPQCRLLTCRKFCTDFQ